MISWGASWKREGPGGGELPSARLHAIIPRMSEYISIEPEYTDDPDAVRIVTNLDLAPDGPERYPTRAAGEEGSALAQCLFEIEVIRALEISGGTLTVWREPDTEWHALIDEISTALKEFFL